MDKDHNELRKQFSRSVVRIEIYHRVPNPANPAESIWPLYTVIPGIVPVSESNFCHIVTCSRGCLYRNQSKFAYQVNFPDGTNVELDINTVELREWLAAFYIGTTNKKVDAVQFHGENASWRDEVRIFGYDQSSHSLLDDGTVTHVGDEDFYHDCPQNSMTCYGHAVFNLENHLVGISYSDKGVTCAYSVKRVIYLLSTFFEGMQDKPLVEMLRHIRAVGEEKYREEL